MSTNLIKVDKLPTLQELNNTNVENTSTVNVVGVTPKGFLVNMAADPYSPSDDVSESLYFAELKLLRTYCHNCLDNKMKDKLIMFLFKKVLYDNAVSLNLVNDANIYLSELYNLLDMKTCNCSINNKTCENGYCELCK